MLALNTTIFALALWFGLYLVNRDWRSMPLRFAGFGLAGYALAGEVVMLQGRHHQHVRRA